MKKRTEYLLNLGLTKTAVLCFVIFSVLIPVRLSAQTSLWKVVNTELRNDDRMFVITLERAALNDEQRKNARIKKMLVVIRNDSTLLSYQPLDAGPSEKLTVDLDNKTEKTSLIELLSDFKKSNDAQKQRASSGLVSTGDEGQNVKSFSGTLGDFDVSYEIENDPVVGGGNYGGYIKLVSKDGDSKKYRAIIEPTALEQAIASADNFRQIQQDAIQTKEKRLAAQKALREEQTQDEIAKAKADSAERLKKEEADRQQQLANTEKQQQLQTIKDTEVEARNRMEQADVKARNKLALAYLSSPDGKALVQQIQSQYKKFISLKEKEGAYIKSLEDRVDALTHKVMDPSLSTLDREVLNEQLQQATGAWVKAGQEYKDSPELTKLRQDLLVLFNKFKASSGMGYDDAMKMSQATQGKQ